MDNSVRDSFLIELKREMGLVGDENLSQDMFPNKQQSQDMFPTEEHVFVPDSESTQDISPGSKPMFQNKQFQQLHDEMVQKYWSATPERSQTLKEASKDFLRFCAIVVKCRNEELMESISEWEQSQIQEESDIDE